MMNGFVQTFPQMQVRCEERRQRMKIIVEVQAEELTCDVCPCCEHKSYYCQADNRVTCYYQERPGKCPVRIIGKEVDRLIDNATPFCPNCGADMRGEEE